MKEEMGTDRTLALLSNRADQRSIVIKDPFKKVPNEKMSASASR